MGEVLLALPYNDETAFAYLTSLLCRYCKGVTAIVYVVDASNLEQIDASKAELHELIAKVDPPFLALAPAP